MPSDFGVRWFSERHIRIDVAGVPAGASVQALCRKVRSSPPEGLIDITPAAASLLLHFDPLSVHDSLLNTVTRLIETSDAADPSTGRRTVTIPFCPDTDLAPDLAAAAHHAGLSTDEFIANYTCCVFTVDFIGFMPGFAYLSGLAPTLHVPRLEQPRSRVPAGSVAIGGEMTGVYPASSPGGWRLIGQTPLRMFDPRRRMPALLAQGDCVRFAVISRGDFNAAAGQGSVS